jgi:serine phosphatase RsbU (regulator of sigma subunit)/anti-sigma regulatory factor (Ser/Thr protein kinase)
LPEFDAGAVGYGTFASEIIQFLPQPVFSAHIDGSVDFIGKNWQALTGTPLLEPSFGALAAAVPDAWRPEFVGAWKRGIARGERFKIETPLRTTRGIRWQIFEAAPARDGDGRLQKWVGTITDVDEARRATAALEESEARLRFLEDAGRAVAESLDMESVASVACRELVGPFCDGAVIESADVLEKTHVVGAGWKARDLIAFRKRLFGATPAFLRYASIPSGPFARAAVIALPIVSGQRFCGILTLVADPSRDDLESDDLSVISIFARRIGTALENARLYARQRRVAETLQAALLPQHLPVLPGIQFDSVYLPNTDEANVGGDWYDAFDLGEGRSAISIGDVAGHGLFAATVMGSARTAIRVAALNGESPDAVLTRTNRLIFSEGRTMVTALFGIVDHATATFRYALAGHPPPIVLAQDGTTRVLQLGGPPLGVMRDLDLVEHSEPVRVDETLLLYTDGIVEFRRDAMAGEEWLRERAGRWARDGRPGGVAQLTRDVLGESESRDDIAMLAATILPEHVIDVTVPAEPRHSSLLREMVREFAENCNVNRARLEDLILGVGEAVNNAMVHAYRGVAGTVRVRARRRENGIVVEVLDNGCWRGESGEQRTATGELSENGRGLMLMRKLADGVEVDATANGTRVTLTVDQRPIE